MYRYIVYPDELLHYGVKGMKWGVRRYQNYDGTRIGTGGEPVIKKGRAISNAYRNSIAGGQGGKATGNARLAATAGGAKKGALDKTIPNGKGKEKISPAEKLARDSSNLATGGKELTRAIRDMDPKHKQKKEAAQNKQLNKAKKMSDQELRDSINRIKMEREYTSLTTKETKSGYDKAMDIMEISGKVLFIVATGLSIASTIKKLKQSGLNTEEEEKALYTFLEKNDVPNDILVHAQVLDTEYLEDWLEHHGVKGMRWGVRRYQNYDGTRIGSSKGVGSGAGGGGGGSSKKASLSSTFKRSIAGGQGGKAKGTSRLAASSKSYGKEPEGYSFERQIHEMKLKDQIKNSKSFREKQTLKKELKTHEKESKKLADEYWKWEKDVHNYTGSTKNYKPIMNGKKFTNEWMHKNGNRTITHEEYLISQQYETILRAQRWKWLPF